jgi:hypothetical protein
VDTTPRARLTVLTWESSPRAFDSILAAASELEKRGGRLGLGRRLWLKNSGDGGPRSACNCAALREKPSRKCFGRGLTLCLARFFNGSEVSARSCNGLTAGRFLLDVVFCHSATGGGVFGPTALTLTLLALALPLRSFSMDGGGGHVGGCTEDSQSLVATASSPFKAWKGFSGKEITSGAASAAAWMRFFSRASGVLCRRKGDGVREVCEDDVFAFGGAKGLFLKAPWVVKMLGLLEELICGSHAPSRSNGEG